MNVPFTRFLQGESAKGRLKSPESIADVLEEEGVDLDRPIICSCGSGASAAVLALGLTLVYKAKRKQNRLVCHVIRCVLVVSRKVNMQLQTSLNLDLEQRSCDAEPMVMSHGSCDMCLHACSC
jgi:hypothetical protein